MLEWILTAHWAGYRFFEEFASLPGERQSTLVAARRTELQIEAIVDYENYKRSRRKPPPK